MLYYSTGLNPFFITEIMSGLQVCQHFIGWNNSESYCLKFRFMVNQCHRAKFHELATQIAKVCKEPGGRPVVLCLNRGFDLAEIGFFIHKTEKTDKIITKYQWPSG